MKKISSAAALMDEAMKDLETFWYRFQCAKPSERISAMPAFHLSRLALEDLSFGASYVVDHLAQLEKVCNSMIDPTTQFGFGDACAFVSGSVEVKLIRLELRCRRLLPSVKPFSDRFSSGS